MTSSSFDVAVAGGGPIGLACAWRAAGRGLRTVVLDAGDPGAWQVAAGMLAPVAEAAPATPPLTELGLRSARSFGAFCAELSDATGEDPGLQQARHADRRARPRRGRGAGAPARLPARARPRGRAAAAEPGAPRRAGARAHRAARARRARRPLGRPAPAGRGARGRLRARRRHAPPCTRRRGRDRRRPRRRAAPGGRRGRPRRPGRARARHRRGRARAARRGARASAAGQGPGAAAARSARARPRDAHDPRPRRLPRPARRRPLRARRDDGGARVGHGADRRCACTSCCAT